MSNTPPRPVAPPQADAPSNTAIPMTGGSEPVLLSGGLDDATRVGPVPSSAAAVPAHVIGGYVVVKKIGEGGIGAVYLAEDTKLGRKVAVKTMKPELAVDRSNRDRFEREARAAAAVEHENIVPIWGIGEAADGSAFIAMPFLQGEMLADRLRRHPVAGLSVLLKVAREVADGLAAAHAKGLIHRDIKPGNIWLEGDLTSKDLAQQIRRCKLLDFGLARSVEKDDSQLTASGAILGTPAYMAPEQARGEKVDHRADLFSLGVVLYRMATGKMPFLGANSMAVLIALATETPIPVRAHNPNLLPALADLIERLMSKDPAKRPQSAAEVSATIRQIVRDLQTKTLAPGAPAAKPAAPAPVAWEEVTEAEVVVPPKASRPAPVKAAPAAQAFEFEEESQPARTPKRKPAAKPSRTPWLIAAGLLALIAAVAVAVVVLRVETGEGTLVVEISDPDVEARVKNGKLVLVGPDGKERYSISASDRNKKIAAGEYKVRVEGADGLVIDTTEFTLKKGTQITVRVTLDPKAVAKKPAPVVPPGALPATFKNSIGMEFVKVPKGTGWLEGVPNEKGHEGYPVVFDRDYFLGKFEVTQGEWEAVMGTNSKPSRAGKNKEAVGEIPDADLKRFPVENVSWDECQAFVKKLNEREKEAGWVYRLPKRAEWEYACRGGPVDKADAAFHFYLDKPTNELPPAQANFRPEPGKGLGRPCPVGAYPPNRLGLHDMHGNAWEWTEDAPVIQGAAHRFVAGGGWDAVAGACRVTNLYAKLPSDRSDAVGLRLIRVPASAVPAPASADPDRKAAEYALAAGGTVFVDSAGSELRAAADLPRGPFRLTGVTLADNPTATDAGLAAFKGCKHLTLLDLSRTRVTDAGLAHFAACTNLQSLNVSETAVTDAGLAHFKDCNGLKGLIVGNTKVTDAGLAPFGECRSLQGLSLGGAPITDAALAHFKGCKLLSFLNLRDTPVTDAGLAHLAGLTQLSALDLAKTKVTATGVDAVKKALPQCKITWDGGVIEPGKASLEADRKAAEWVLAIGGTVRVNGQEPHLKAAGDLPREPFRLTEVILGDNKQVTDAELVTLKDCRNLVALTLNRTKVTDAGLANFKEHTNLKYVWLVSIKMTDAGLANFQNCKQLVQLSVGEAAITDAGLALFKDQKRLAILTIDGTKVTDAGLVHLKNFPALWHLQLQNTGVTDAGLLPLAECKNINSLYLSGTAVTDAGLARIAGLDKLTELRLTKSKVTKVGVEKFAKALPKCKIEWDGGTVEPVAAADPDRKAAEYVISVGGTVGVGNMAVNALAGLPKEPFPLRTVILNTNKKVTDAGLAVFKECKNLSYLDLAGTPVTDAGLAHFKDCPNVAYLNLSDAPVTDAGLAHFKDCKGLGVLQFVATGITDAGLAHFKDCTNLTHATLQKTKVTAKGVADFAKAHPQCKIEWDGGGIEPAKK